MGAGAGQSLSVDRLRGQSDGGLALGSISEAKRSGLLGLSPFYLVGRVATVLGASARAIRYYEERGLLDPSRVGTVRQYTRQQLERARFVVDARRADITIANIKILLDLGDRHGRTEQARLCLELAKGVLARAERKCATLAAEVERCRTLLQSLGGGESEADAA
jgi:DNA-binding transcriptional MerR regulator